MTYLAHTGPVYPRPIEPDEDPEDLTPPEPWQEEPNAAIVTRATAELRVTVYDPAHRDLTDEQATKVASAWLEQSDFNPQDWHLVDCEPVPYTYNTVVVYRQ